MIIDCGSLWRYVTACLWLGIVTDEGYPNSKVATSGPSGRLQICWMPPRWETVLQCGSSRALTMTELRYAAMLRNGYPQFDKPYDPDNRAAAMFCGPSMEEFLGILLEIARDLIQLSLPGRTPPTQKKYRPPVPPPVVKVHCADLYHVIRRCN